MKRFAAVPNAGVSHQMTMSAIGRELQKLGHEFLLIGTAFQSNQLRLSDIPFQVVGGKRKDPAQEYCLRAQQEGAVPISATIEYMKGMADLLCSELPAIFREGGIDFVLADQEEPGAATSADLAGLPYASICSSLPLNEAPEIPPGFLGWTYSSGLFAAIRNRFSYAIRNRVLSGVHKVLNIHRGASKLKAYKKPDDSFSTLAQITQLVKEFDFPRKPPGPAFHYVGPFQRQPLTQVEFPYHRLNGFPLVYASFGTSFGNRLDDLRAIAEACTGLPVQLVVSLGGARVSSEHDQLPGGPIVVAYAPQHDLLSRSAVAVTHAGLNTTMEALSLGVPLLAMPIAGDQFGVSSRVLWHGVGRMLGARERKAENIRGALLSLLSDARWGRAAKRLAAVIGQSGGAVQAAAIVDAAARGTTQASSGSDRRSLAASSGNV